MSNNVALGKKKIHTLRSVFPKELDFNKWLAENNEYLAEQLNVEELTTVGTEVAPYNKKRVDIVMQTYRSDDDKPCKIVIENQYGNSDDEHFSKLITYAVSIEAKYAIWICEKLHDEHRRAINYLNNIGAMEKINFYVFRAIVESIDDSKPCISLFPECTPSDEFLISSAGRKEGKLLSARKRFWTYVAEKIANNNKIITTKPRTPSTDSWYCIAIGSRGVAISINALAQERNLRIDLYIWDNKNLYDDLHNKKIEIENKLELGELCWSKKDDTKSAKISYLMDIDFDIYAEEQFEEYTNKLIDVLEKFCKIKPFVNKALLTK